jgi:Pyruvate/2-oxoacid:ferredoxin oxidoreductase gamma subunit
LTKMLNEKLGTRKKELLDINLKAFDEGRKLVKKIDIFRNV